MTQTALLMVAYLAMCEVKSLNNDVLN